ASAHSAQCPPGTDSLRACTQRTLRQRCRVADGILKCRARSVNNHSPVCSRPVADRATGLGPLRPPLARKPATMSLLKCAEPNSDRAFSQIKTVWIRGAGGRFPAFLKILENDGATGLGGSSPRCGSLGPGRHASAAPTSAWLEFSSWLAGPGIA